MTGVQTCALPIYNILVLPVEATSETLERIHVTTTISMQLTEAAKEDTPTAKLKEMLLKPYLSFQDVFSKESFKELQNGSNGTTQSTLSQSSSCLV